MGCLLEAVKFVIVTPVKIIYKGLKSCFVCVCPCCACCCECCCP